MNVRKISRKIRVSKEEAGKLGVALFSGWTLNGEWYEKLILVPQICEAENTTTIGGTCDVGTVNTDSLVQAVAAFVEAGVPAKTLAECLNNGVYLAYNASEKPRKESKRSLEAEAAKAAEMARLEKFARFGKEATPEQKAEFFASMATGGADAYIAEWSAKNP